MAKISKTKIDAIIKNNKKPVEIVELSIGENNIAVEIDPIISPANFIDAANELADMQFAIDKQTGTEVYAPYLSELAEWYVALKYFTNIDTSVPAGENDPGSKAFERLWALRYCDELRKEIDAIPDMVEIIYVARNIVEDRRKTARPGISKVLDGITKLIEPLKDLVDQMTLDDIKELAETFAEAAAHGDGGNIVDFPTGKNNPTE